MSHSHAQLDITAAAAPGGHTHCTNCGAALQGPYCHVCGQAAKNILKHLPALTEDALDVVFNVDGRLMHTLPALYLRPGFLAREYFAGRRARYIAPFRLMFFMSVLAFVVIQFNLSLHRDLFAHARIELGSKSAQKAAPAAAADTSGAPASDTVSSVHMDWLPDFANDRVNAGIDQARLNLHAMKSSDGKVRANAMRRFLTHMLAVLPQTLLVLIPLFAVILKVAYIFKRRLYIEHLMVALYSHAFIFMSLLLWALLALARYALPAWAAPPVAGLQMALWIWLAVYLLVMQKRIYMQGWLATVVKYGVVGLCYSVLLTFALAGAAMLSLAT